MRQILRIGTVVALLLAMTGCASLPWSSSKKEAQSEQPGQEGQVSAAVGDSRPAPAQANGSVPAQTVQVLFAFDRSELSQPAQAELLFLVKKLRADPKLTVGLEGFADSVGGRDYNLQLSQKRVETVRRFLVDKGVEAARIRSAALGPLPDGGAPADRAKNRRVTVKLTPASD